MSTAFTDTERAILRIVQFQLPDTLTPYADIAREVGPDEETVLNLLRRMKEDGSIRRFGASIKHQRTGWKHNAMVAWIIDPALADEAGATLRTMQMRRGKLMEAEYQIRMEEGQKGEEET